MLGMGEGGRRRGRPCMRWKDNIKTVMGLTLSELVRAVENRNDWRQLITTITRSRPQLDGTRHFRSQASISYVFSTALFYVRVSNLEFL
ncbi:ecdysteroid UDP-glucosyltransferase [Elysia marginata]|uniref:Ecdysteroid UDP-glucosyltransferase n=1 Tax=Elysia marginata TaxID=1093978 RepID=A0AAV4HVG7_9GAST|nr:ecdysteroid UDP-glucosyltransferase [Elysia marginata]